MYHLVLLYDLILLMNKNQAKIVENNNILEITIPLDSLKFKEIKLILNKLIKKEKENEDYKESFSITKDLKQEIKVLKEENKELKKRISNIEIYIPYFEEYKKKKEYQKTYILNLDSLIIDNNEKYNMALKHWINPDLKIKAKLLYRASRDGDSFDTFHKLCDYQKPAVELIKLKNGYILGSYTTLDWETKSNWKSDPKLFVFSLTENIKAKKKESKDNLGIECLSGKGPESYLLAFDHGYNMRTPRIRLDDKEYSINTQLLAPKLSTGKYYSADEVEIFKIIIG